MCWRLFFICLFFAPAGQARRDIPHSVPYSAVVYFWFGFLQMFNPASTSIFFGILGMKVYFLYVPLIFVGYSLLESQEDLHRFFSFTCVLILVVAGLGLAQSIIGPTFLNPSTLQADIRELSTLTGYPPSPERSLIVPPRYSSAAVALLIS